jgi:predicted peroxiredoxin
MNSKFLVNANYGPDNAEKATISFILAFTSSKTHETAVFAASGAADLLVKSKRPTVHAQGYEPLNGLIDGFVENGGKIWLCPACAKAKGVAQEDLIEGVEIAGAPKTMAYLESGARILA